MSRDTRPAGPRPRGKPQDGHLSEERLRFCEGLLEGKSLRQAYEESGFKARGTDAKSCGRQLLQEPEVQFYLAVRRMELWERASFTADRVIAEISRIAFFDPADIVLEGIDEPADIADLPEHMRRVVVGWKYDKSGKILLELADKQKALDALARILGLYQQGRVNHADSRSGEALLQTVFWRYVISLHEHEGCTVGEAYAQAQREPGAVETWGRARGLLQAAETSASEG